MKLIKHKYRCIAALAALLLSPGLHAQMPGTPYGVGCQDLSPSRDGSTSAKAGRSCLTILTAFPSSTDGVYWIDPDGDCGTTYAPMQAQCDMTTDGGGWTMVMNYLYKAGTPVVTNNRASSFPLLGSSTLGTDESGTSYWGNANAAILNKISFTSVRFYGITNYHARVLHFKTSLAGVISFIKTGTGSMSGVQSSFTALSGHTANLPGAATNFYTPTNPNATLYGDPFYFNGSPPAGAAWGFDDGSLFAPQVEMDFNCDCTSYNVLMRAWVK